MKASRTIRYVAAAALVTGGCAIMLRGSPWGLHFFFLSSLVLMRRSELNASVRLRDFWIGVLFLTALVGLYLLVAPFIPETAGRDWQGNPYVVGTICALALAAIASRWREEKKSETSVPGADSTV